MPTLVTQAVPDDRTANKRVLVVDDDIALGLVLEHALQDAGYTVGSATNGLEGLERYRKESWDAVVVDRAMPAMNGEVMAQRVKEVSPTQTIILMTGLACAISRPALFDQILIKPFSIVTLLASLATHIG